MDQINSYFHFSKEQKKGLFVLIVLILSLQSLLFFGDFSENVIETKAEREWLALQKQLDVLKKKRGVEGYIIHPFNPNFISDYKGYKLGMSVVEIDRLLAFRKQNKYVNSAAEFQKVTKISDSLLQTMVPYFKFPDWVKNKKGGVGFSNFEKKATFKINRQVKDINQATTADLIAIYGVGDKLSERILIYKEKVGGFVSMEQISEVWGLSPEVIDELNKNFKITNTPVVKKIAINDVSLKELSQFVYFKYALAKQIVIYRSMNGNFKNIEDLAKIKDFPVEKANIIDLYLEF